MSRGQSRGGGDVGLLSRPSISRALVMLLTLTVSLQICLLLRSQPVGCGNEPVPRHLPSLAAAPPPPPGALEALAAQPEPVVAYPVPQPWSKALVGQASADWAVYESQSKRGAGLLFFAYGGKQLGHFLDEARTAAESFRKFNPRIKIAVVSNTNRKLDNRTFDMQIRPRPDLLFAGSLTNGDWGDKLPRQWLTRLYYLAHSPFRITWALDSNVYACTPNSAQAFLDDVMRAERSAFFLAAYHARLL